MSKIKSREYRGGPAKYAHVKLDGHFTRVEMTKGGPRFYTSKPTEITHKIPQRLWSPVFSAVPVGSVLLGELHVPGYEASQVKTALNEQSDLLELTYFAIESHDPRTSLEHIRNQFERWELPFAPFAMCNGEQDAENVDETRLWQLLPELAPKGAEGYVLKDGNLLNWQKLKRVRTIDLIVLDDTDGDGKYLGFIGSLVCCTTEGRVVANVSGMTDEERINMTLSTPVGRVIEVAYQYVGARGRLRHPRFVRFRNDKTPEECTLDQDPQLVERWAGRD